MKSYPSITNTNFYKFVVQKYHTFYKIDGSNFRAEWSNKRGWYKFGTRTELIDANHPVFGEAVPVFYTQLSNDLEAVFAKLKIKNAVIFAEFAGYSSFAGNHVPGEEKNLYLFDVALDKKGIIGPERFLNYFGHCKITPYLGYYLWDDSFLDNVKNNTLTGHMLQEGVVGKIGDYHKLCMVKAKTNNWIERVKKNYKNYQLLIRS